MSSHADYVHAATESGYNVSEDNTALVIDRGNCFHVVAQDNVEGEWLVSRFYKQSLQYNGDYAGLPDFEGSLEDCVKYVSTWPH